MIRVESAHLNVAAQTHAGMTGKNNEDRYAITSFQLSEDDLTPVLFAIVADGIGGHLAGEVAAEMAVDYISEAVEESDARRPKKILERAIHEASDAIADHASSTSSKKGMGATCACVWVIDDKLYTATVGDSRIYLLREGRIQQLTTDHSWVQEAIEKNIIKPEQAHKHPNVHVIRRYLGSPEPPEVDFRLRLFDGEGDALAEGNQGMQIRPGNTFLICSDGLTDLVWNDEIAEIIRAKPNIKTAAQELVDTANQRGGHDNTTVVLIRVPHDLKMIPPKKKETAALDHRWRHRAPAPVDLRICSNHQPAAYHRICYPHPNGYPQPCSHSDSNSNKYSNADGLPYPDKNPDAYASPG